MEKGGNIDFVEAFPSRVVRVTSTCESRFIPFPPLIETCIIGFAVSPLVLIWKSIEYWDGRVCVGPGVPNPEVGRVFGVVVIEVTGEVTCVIVGVGVAVGVTGLGVVHPALNRNPTAVNSVNNKISRFICDNHAN